MAPLLPAPPSPGRSGTPFYVTAGIGLLNTGTVRENKAGTCSLYLQRREQNTPAQR